MVKLLALMGLTSGSADLAVGLIDGPVANDHPDLATGQIRTVGRSQACSPSNSAACVHGTGIAGILFARRCSRCHADSTIVLDGEPCDVPLKRVFAIDLSVCPHCGGRLRVIAGGRRRTSRTRMSSSASCSIRRDSRGCLKACRCLPEPLFTIAHRNTDRSESPAGVALEGGKPNFPFRPPTGLRAERRLPSRVSAICRSAGFTTSNRAVLAS